MVLSGCEYGEKCFHGTRREYAKMIEKICPNIVIGSHYSPFNENVIYHLENPKLTPKDCDLLGNQICIDCKSESMFNKCDE